jgi:hypothetical protein
MNETSVRVVQREDGQWVVFCPGGDQYSYPNQGQAEAFANGFRVFFDERASSGAIRDALSRLEENQLNIDLARRLRSKLERAIKKEESY